MAYPEKPTRKYTKKSKYWSSKRLKNDPTVQDDLLKAGNTDQVTSRLKLGEIGSAALSTIQYYVDWLKPYELRWPLRLRTFDKMADEDPDVFTALEANYLYVEKAFDSFDVTGNNESDISIEATAFVKWCFNNMQGQTLKQAIRSAITFKKYGFSVLEKVYTQITQGEYKGRFKIKRLAYRPQETTDISQPFVYFNGGRDIRGYRQNTSYFMNSPNVMAWDSQMDNILVEIPRNKFLLFNTNGTDSNPMGMSPLVSIYNSWREKNLIQEYETVGVTKDMGGLPVLEVPNDILNRAAEDPTSPEALSIQKLTSDLANLHAGSQSYMIIPSDIQEGTTGVKQYALTLKGVDGMGKQFNTTELIAQRKKEIYDRFGAGLLLMGNGQQGSYALSDSKATLHAHFIGRDVSTICDVINNDLIPQLLAMNGIFLDDIDMPRLIPSDISDQDIEANSKMIQRVCSVGAIPLTPEVRNEFLKMCRLSYRIPAEVSEDPDKFSEFISTYVPDKTSRAGDGMTSAGDGTSDTVSSLDNSTNNMDNAS